MKRLRLKRWVKVVLKVIIVLIIVITVKDLFTKQEVISNGNNYYTCNGNFIFKICSGNYEE